MKEGNLGGRIYLVLIGLALAAMGSIFVALLWKGYQNARLTKGWQEKPAVVLESASVARSLGPSIPREYALKLLYEYQVEQKSYFGERLRLRDNPWFKEKAKADAMVERWRVGQQVTAWVNPENPAEAVLEHETKAPGYSLWFPALFVVGGLGIVIRAFTGASRPASR